MSVREVEVLIQAGDAELEGALALPEGAVGLVLFAHGSGSSRHSPRNRRVAAALHDRGVGTLLFDLLTVDESGDRQKVFDIGLLARRLGAAARWVRAQPAGHHLPLGFFGASTGGAAAIVAAADAPGLAAAVVSRGGRPDLAGDALSRLAVPALLIVGGNDDAVLELHRKVMPALAGVASLVIVPGATHLFEEPGALDEVARLAAEWFRHHLARASPA